MPKAEILRYGKLPAPSRHRSRLLSQTVCRLAQAPPTPFIDGRKSVASRAHTNMRATTEGAEILRYGKLPAPSRHRSQTLPQTMRRLAKAPPAPFIDGRESVASHAHTNMRAKPEGAEIPRSGNSLRRRAIALGHSPRPCAGSGKHRRPRLSMVENRSRRAPASICVQRPRGPKSLGPATACAVAPSLSATLPNRARHPVHSRRRFSMLEICSFDRPRQYACKHRCDRIPKVRQTARAVVPSLSHTHSGCARRPAHSRRRFSMLENLSDRPPTPTCVQASV
jgi:hypothetical protein